VLISRRDATLNLPGGGKCQKCQPNKKSPGFKSIPRPTLTAVKVLVAGRRVLPNSPRARRNLVPLLGGWKAIPLRLQNAANEVDIRYEFSQSFEVLEASVGSPTGRSQQSALPHFLTPH